MEGINNLDLGFQLKMRPIRQGACGTLSQYSFQVIRGVGDLSMIKTDIKIVELNNIYPIDYEGVRVRAWDNRR